jgi:hypothetical protein
MKATAIYPPPPWERQSPDWRGQAACAIHNSRKIMKTKRDFERRKIPASPKI